MLTDSRSIDCRIAIVRVRPDAINDTVTGLIAIAAGSSQQRSQQALRIYRDNSARSYSLQSSTIRRSV